MKWTDVAKAFPARPWRERDDSGAPEQVAYQVEAIATALARETLGLRAAPLDRANALRALRVAGPNARFAFGPPRGKEEATQRWKAMMALAAAAFGDWDVVIACAGGGSLGHRIRAGAAFGIEDGCKLARYLATAARARAPAADVIGAMMRLRDQFVADELKPDARLAILAGRVFFERIAGEADVAAACRAWLEDGTLEVGQRFPHRQAVADGEDVAVQIFERYMPALGDTDMLAEARIRLASKSTERGAMSDGQAIILFLAGESLPRNWERPVDPFVARWLGAKVDAAALAASRARIVQRRRDHPVRKDDSFDDIMHALHVGDRDTIHAFTPAPTANKFTPGQFFKDDAYRLVRYLDSAHAAKATVADVEPAWLDFLARRSPTSNAKFKGGDLRWRHLLVIQHVITERIGRGKPAAVGLALRKAITGR